MAVAAETLAPLYENQYLLVDAIPEVDADRDTLRQESWALLEGRRSDGQRQGTEAFLLPVDALSTAHVVLDISRRYGEDSPECKERYGGLLLDCQRLVSEWYRKKKPEYFAEIRHYFNAETEEFYSHGFSIPQMTRNALIPMADNQEEEARRVNEHVEDATPQLLRRHLGQAAMAGVAIRTVSQCTYKAQADYARDQAAGAEHTGYDGYVPEIAKVMLRDICLKPNTLDRYEEVVGLPGDYITEDIFELALAERGIDVSGMDRTELHGAQILARDGLMGKTGFVALLDEVASRAWCTNIYMGEVVAPDFVKDYDQFCLESSQRQESLQDQAATIATFVLDLARDNVDRRDALIMVEDFVKKMMLDIAKADENVAEQMFDVRTAEGLKEVRRLEDRGEYEAAFEKLQEVEKMAPGGGSCGGNSCGLESVNTSSKEGIALAKELGATTGDKIVTDKVRKCASCGGKVSYAYNATHVKKYCHGCHKKENKISVAAA